MPISALDAFLRHQINVERYKNYNVQQSLGVVETVKNRLFAQLARTGKDKLSDLNRREFNKFVADFNKSYTEIMGKYQTAQLAEFKKFFKADFAENRYLFGAFGDATKGAKVDTLWARMLQSPASGIGIEPKNMLNVFSRSAQAKLTSTLKVGYADNLQMSDVVRSLIGTAEAKFRNGVMNKLEGQLSSTVQTYIQQMTNFIQTNIGGSLHDQYQWVSILDNVTTDICRERDGKVYNYGDGPTPPAHYNCRSFTMPVIGAPVTDMPTLFGWLQDQPVVIQNEILGKNLGQSLRAGKVTANDIPSLNRMTPLNLDQFKGKRSQLLTQ